MRAGTFIGGGFSKTAHENEEREQTFLMPFRAQQREHIRLALGIARGQERARLRHRDAEKLVARAICAGAGLEEAERAHGPLGIGESPECFAQVAEFHFQGKRTRRMRGG